MPDKLATMSDLIARHLADPDAAWAIGAYGAVAEFRRDALEPAVVGPRQVVTARGAVVITAHLNMSMIDREVSDEHGGRVRSIGFTLPRSHAAMPLHRTFTELGPDLDAVRPYDQAILFDLGLGFEHCRACVRTANAALLEILRAAAGTALLRDGALFSVIAAASPHRVFLSRLGRIEVYGRIPHAAGVTPAGPHTHVLPALLGRAPTPDPTLLAGEVICLELFPPASDA
jgi:hypothetical protein